MPFERTVESIETRVIDEVLETGGIARVPPREMREVRFRDADLQRRRPLLRLRDRVAQRRHVRLLVQAVQ